MAKKPGLKSVKRYGVRYGRTTKNKVAKIESGYRNKNKCPYCHYVGVKRVAAGIWSCKKCGVKFAGKAYTPEIRKRSVEA
jgi:large subunit ribosomal protein L37Ae